MTATNQSVTATDERRRTNQVAVASQARFTIAVAASNAHAERPNTT